MIASHSTTTPIISSYIPKMEHYSIDQQLKRYSRLTLPCHKLNIHSVRWNPDGTMLASGGKDKTLHLHRVTESELVFEQRYSKEGHSGDIDQLCWNPENVFMLATASIDRYVKIWDIRQPEPIDSIKLKNENITLCWSGNGSTIAVADKGDLVSFIDVQTRKIVMDQKFQFEVGEITWNREGDLFFVTSGDGKVHVLSYPDLHTLLVIDAFASPCVCIRFDATGKYFAVGSNDAIASVWDTENLACIQAIDRLDWPIKTVSFSFDSRYIASGSEDSFIDIADIFTGQQVAAIDVNFPTLTLDFHPKEYILAYALDERDYRDIGTIKVVGFPEERRREDKTNHRNY